MDQDTPHPGATGLELIEDPGPNKGSALSLAEREAHGLLGLLPHAVEALERQAERVLGHLEQKTSDLERYIYLIGPLDRNETLFYRVVMGDPVRFLPIVYDPTVGEACLKFGHIYRRARLRRRIHVRPAPGHGGSPAGDPDMDRGDAVQARVPGPGIAMPGTCAGLTLRDLPIGIEASGRRTETDSMGSIEVPADRYWGAQTQRSLVHFSIGDDRMPRPLYHACGLVKKAAAPVNAADGRLQDWKAAAIVRAADGVIAGKLDEHFPLCVWQTGSGPRSNMNLNEVLSNRAIQLLGGELASKSPVHPNDDVNMGQSSNDSFPIAIHVAAGKQLADHLLPRLDSPAGATEAKAQGWDGIVKIGRTHLEHAAPLTVGQNWSGYAHQICDAIADVRRGRDGLMELAIGGTAVGTGLNAPPGFSAKLAAKIAALTGQRFVTAPNEFAAQGLAGRDGAGPRHAARRRGRADEDRQRHALAGLRSALRPRRAAAAGRTSPASRSCPARSTRRSARRW